ncbi:MAG: CHAT domain-containing protein [Geminocystis sp.]|nr:CHAT domain-containing protein [Geminocystis sp.]HIK38647.1 CHAT domain-containing protein [Geminocystis sp. M7585_C2015_104]
MYPWIFTLVLAFSSTSPTPPNPYSSSLISQYPSDVQQLYDQVNLLYHRGEYAKAIVLAEELLARVKEKFGHQSMETAIAINVIGHLQEELGNYTQAEELFQQSLTILSKTVGENHPYTATVINNLGLLYSYQGKYPQAEELLMKSLQIRIRLRGEEDGSVAESLNNLGMLYYYQGRYDQAESFYQRAIIVARRAFGDNHPTTATLLSNLAQLYTTAGNYIRAESLLQQSLSIRQEVLGDKHPDTAYSLNNLGLLYYQQGNYAEAEKLFAKALYIFQETLGEKNPIAATAFNNLAESYSQQGKTNQALPLYEKSLQIRLEILGEIHPDVAQSYNNIAGIYFDSHDYQQAAILYAKALEIQKQTVGEKHADTIRILINLAESFLRLGQYQTAETQFQNGLNLAREVLGDKHPILAESLSSLASLYWLTKKYPLALDYLQQTTEVEEYNLSQFLYFIGDESRKLLYLNTLKGTTNASISLHLNYLPDNKKAAELALTTILRRKGRVLDAMSDIMATLRQNSNPQTEALFDSLAQKKSLLASLSLGKTNLPPPIYQQTLLRLEEEIRQLETQLSAKSAQYRTLTQPIALEAVREALPQDTVLVEYTIYHPLNVKTLALEKPRYAAYLLHPDGNVQGIDLAEAETIDSLITQFRLNLAAGEEGDSTVLTQSSQQLYQLLFQPLLPYLQDKKNLFISPDGQLNLIPFAALQDNKGNYLIEEYTFNYLTSGRELLRIQNRFPSASPPVIVAAPDYDSEYKIDVKVINRGVRRNIQLRNLSCCTPLEGTKQEAQAIISLIPDSQLYVGVEATVDKLFTLRAPKILHIATHGFFLPPPAAATPNLIPLNPRQNPTIQDNPLLFSGLAFAGFNPSKGKTEGVLTALEATNLYLWGTQLVVLSACQTGVGEVRQGEGVYGLRRALVLAGAESQLISLWDVFDDATRELMGKYYLRLARGEERVQALRQVQLEMLNSKQYQHPVFWAAFIPSGDWRSLY